MASKVPERLLLRWVLWLAAYRQPMPRGVIVKPRPPAPDPVPRYRFHSVGTPYLPDETAAVFAEGRP